MSEQARGRRLGPLGRLAVAALVGVAVVAIGGSLLLSGSVNEFSLMPAVIALVLAGLMTSGWRWAQILAAVLSSLLLLAMGAFITPSLTLPHEPEFVLVVLFLSLMVVATGSAIGEATQNVRGRERRAPSWTSKALIGLGGLVLGAILVGLVSQPGAAGVSPEVMAGLPEVRAEDFSFTQETIRVTAGETVALRLENADTTAHSFDIDELDIHAPMPSEEPGLALFEPTEPGVYRFYCGIPGHANLETGTGMIGTLVVEEPAS
ncbi:MAG: cupredoxin domain-containing protein [Candidatus Promineifilaceae bacterium]|nr:cupredoxin domain-containing protein [Candidatus Promineifilaceae bacterium]